MMLKNNIKVILGALGVTGKEISEYAGMAPANIGKLTNGSRVPAKSSSTAEKLVNGIYEYSRKNKKSALLCETIGCSKYLSEEKVKRELREWLYRDVPARPTAAERFSERFNDMLAASGTDAVELVTATGADKSAISRISAGERQPGRKSALLNGICAYIAEKSAKNGRMDDISALVGVSGQELREANAAQVLAVWLIAGEKAVDGAAAAHLIGDMTSPARTDIALPDFADIAEPDILNEDKTLYVGVSGLQRAVIRFLGNAAKNRETELFLYSDQSMEWMQARFTPKWLTLMRECFKNGTRMKIIHNIDRDPSEMLFAVHSWMPLYMTGLIEPYYRIDKSGDRFRHTLFISGSAVIDGFCTPGSERSCVYRYTTDSEYLVRVKESFSQLSYGIKPLLIFKHGEFVSDKQYKVYDCGEVRILLSDRDAVVCRKNGPICSFRFTHPYLVRIFRMYAQSNGSRSE